MIVPRDSLHRGWELSLATLWTPLRGTRVVASWEAIIVILITFFHWRYQQTYRTNPSPPKNPASLTLTLFFLLALYAEVTMPH